MSIITPVVDGVSIDNDAGDETEMIVILTNFRGDRSESKSQLGHQQYKKSHKGCE